MVRTITENEKKELLSLTRKSLTHDKFLELLGSTMSKSGGKASFAKSRFEPTDVVLIKKGEYFNNADVKTTVGRLLYNKFIIENKLEETLGYMNEPIDGDKLNGIEDTLGKAFLRDDITPHQMIQYLDETQWIAMQLHTAICGSYTVDILKPVPEMQKHRDKMIKENIKDIENGDVMKAVKIEKECLDIAVAKVKDDPAMELFNAKARGSIGNNYKNISVIKGPVFNPATGKFELVQSNFMEGIRKEELAIQANAVVTGAYPKAIGTATSGYFSKQLTAALQAVVLDVHGSDCKTKYTVEQEITKSNKQGFMQRYILEGTKLTLLDDSNMSKYIGKRVKLRSPMMCNGTKICNKCAGEMFYLLGITNMGLTSSRAASTMLNMKMKKFHDATAKTSKIDKATMFIQS